MAALSLDANTDRWVDTFNEATMGKITVGLPDTIFSAVMVANLNGQSTNVDYALLYVVYFVVLALQVVIALTLHEAVVQVEGDLARNCGSTSWFAKFSSVTVFVIFILREVGETWDMWTYLTFFEIGESSEDFKCGRFKDEDHDVVDASTAKAAGFPDMHGRVMRPMSKLSLGMRRAFVIFIIFPKALVGLFVLLAGSGTILRANNNFDVVLNSVAAAFLLEVDDVAYRVLVPNKMKKSAGHTPMFGFSLAEYRSSRLKRMRKFTAPLYIIAIAAIESAIIYGYWCTAAAPGTPFYPASGEAGSEHELRLLV